MRSGVTLSPVLSSPGTAELAGCLPGAVPSNEIARYIRATLGDLARNWRDG